MLNEIWLPVPWFEGQCEVSSLGAVRSLDRVVPSLNRWGQTIDRRLKGRVLKSGNANRYGRQSVSIGDRTGWRVHSIIMLAFWGETPEGLEIRYLDGDPRNNALSNLMFVTHSENMKDLAGHNRRNLTVENVAQVRERYAAGEPGYLLARDYQVCVTSIYYVLRGATYAHF